MSGKRIRFVSKPVQLAAGDDVAPSTHTLGEWTVSEEYHRVTTRLFSHTSGPYRIVVTTNLVEGEDPGLHYLHGASFTTALDRAFSYATGRPLGGRSHRYLLRPTTPALGWELDEGTEHIDSGDLEMISDGLSFDAHQLTSEGLPLAATMRALDAIVDADDVTSRLCTLHYGAQTASDPDLTPLLYAQGLELISPLLKGATKAARQAALPPFVRERMPRALDWHFEVSNKRVETRHSLESRAKPSLFPRFSEQELSDFYRGADILLRFVACERLKIPLVACDDGTSVTAS